MIFHLLVTLDAEYLEKQQRQQQQQKRKDEEALSKNPRVRPVPSLIAPSGPNADFENTYPQESL